ncbi:MAG TPA: nuclear transport factor 2 family protein [Arthrobacter sp.]|nr:nuclear transport factor 2 family protein [Arthrobacter sp.]
MTTIIPEICTPAWAHTAGVIDLQTVAAVPADFTTLADRAMIQETAARYAVAYDEGRLDVIKSLMTESTVFSNRVGEGETSSQVGRPVVLKWLGEVMQSQSDQRRHLLGSLVIERLTADEATVVTYTAIYGIEREAKLVTTGMYIFKMVKHDCRWLIDDTLVALDRPF